jgi:hypothetical protein
VNFDWPSTGIPVHIFWVATVQKSPKEVRPSFGRTARAAATNTRNIQGEQILAKLANFSNPRIARLVTTNPTQKTTTIQVMLVGNISFNSGMGMLKGSPTAVAATEIIAPARKQNIKALTTL